MGVRLVGSQTRGQSDSVSIANPNLGLYQRQSDTTCSFTSDRACEKLLALHTHPIPVDHAFYSRCRELA